MIENQLRKDKKIKILSFGEIIWDVYPDKKTLGGAPLNFAGHLAKSGVESYLLSAVGKDELGKLALQKIDKLGVNRKYVKAVDKPTGICRVTLNESGLPEYEIPLDVAYDDIKLPKNLLREDFDAISFGTLALRKSNNLNVLKKILSSGKMNYVYCDLNLRKPFFNHAIVEFCLSFATVLKVNEEELSYIGNDFLTDKNLSLKDKVKGILSKFKNIKLLILTCGENGSYAFKAQDFSETFYPALKVELKSTVGAGDSFGAVFLANYLKGEDINTCLRLATERSAYVVSKYEAIPD